MKTIEGGVTAAAGYQAIGIAAGIKKGKKDMPCFTARFPAGWPELLPPMW